MNFFVYLLVNKNFTYVGSTTDLEHRLRQHNNEIKGGARYTHSKGTGWIRVAHVKNFPTWNSALQFEWKWKNITKNIKNKNSLERRLDALQTLLNLEKSTNNSIPFSQWDKWPEVVFEQQLLQQQ